MGVLLCPINADPESDTNKNFMYELAQDKMMWSGTGKESVGDYCIFLFQSSNTRICVCTVITDVNQKARTHWTKKDNTISLSRLNVCVKLDDLYKILNYKTTFKMRSTTYKNIIVPIPTMATQAFNVSIINPAPKSKVKAPPPSPVSLTTTAPAQIPVIGLDTKIISPNASTSVINDDHELLISIIDNSMSSSAEAVNLYFIGQHTGHNSENCYKIIITRNKLQPILKELQAGNPNVLYVYRAHSCTDYNMAHKFINNNYGGRHIMNGWFHISKKEIDELIEALASTQ
jgi:hypothetical protein